MIQFDFEIEHQAAIIEIVCKARVYGHYCPPTTVCPGEHPELEIISTIVVAITADTGEKYQQYDGYKVGEDTDRLTRTQLLSLQDAGWRAVRRASEQRY